MREVKRRELLPWGRGSRLFLCATLLLGAASAQLSACNGNGGSARLELTTPATGHPVTLTLTGAPGAPYLVAGSDAIAPSFAAPFGWVCADMASPNFSIFFSGTLPPSGAFSVTFTPPPTLFWNDIVYFHQAAVVDATAPGGLAISNLRRMDYAPPDSYDVAGLGPGVVPSGTFGPSAFGAGARLPDGSFIAMGGNFGDLIPGTLTAGAIRWFQSSRSLVVAAPMTTPRAHHSATPLQDGRVLVVGGAWIEQQGAAIGLEAALETCEIFVPATGTWMPAASMSAGRSGHTAVALDDGRVLVAGGGGMFAGSPIGPFGAIAGPAPPVASAILYDPVSDVWLPAGNVMQSERVYGTATKLADGRVLLAGGVAFSAPLPGSFPGGVHAATATCDVFDPTTGLFSPAASLPGGPTAGHQATRLPDGRVWLTGGSNAVSASIAVNTASTWIYDPASDIWSAGPTLPVAVCHHRQTALSDGRVYLSGGSSSFFNCIPPWALNSAALSDAGCVFDGTTLVVTQPLPSMNPPTSNLCTGTGNAAQVLFPLDDGTVVAAGGSLAYHWGAAAPCGAVIVGSISGVPVLFRYIPTP